MTFYNYVFVPAWLGDVGFALSKLQKNKPKKSYVKNKYYCYHYFAFYFPVWHYLHTGTYNCVDSMILYILSEAIKYIRNV